MGCITSRQLPPINPDQVDLSHFIICRVLGRGGFGKVNAVQRRCDERYFAMKTISKHRLVRKEHSVYMTWLERTVMSSFHSHFLVSCVYAFQDAQHLYMVMPLMLGGDLRYYLKQNGPCRESEARFFMAEILLALEHMHSLRIVYRDLKPDNILLDDTGHLRLSDFGLSGRIRSQDGKTSGFCGTHGYVAPEVREGRRYDGSCDFYAFGVVLYELLCRYVPSRVKEQRARLILEEAMMGGGGGARPAHSAAVKPASPTDEAKQPHQHQQHPSPAQQQRDEQPDHPSPHPPPDPPSSSSSPLDLDELFDPRLTRKSKGLSPACIDLLTGLLQPNSTLRLGSRSPHKWDEVKQHEWFAPIDWEAAAARQLTPPFIPNVTIANCDPVWELEEQIMGGGGGIGGGRKGARGLPALTPEEQAVFAGWEFGVKGEGVEGGGGGGEDGKRVEGEGGKGEVGEGGMGGRGPGDGEVEEELKAREWGVREEEVKVDVEDGLDAGGGSVQRYAGEVGYEGAITPPHLPHDDLHDGDDPSYITQG